MRKQFLIRLIIISSLLASIGIFFSFLTFQSIPTSQHLYFLIVPIAAFTINVISFYMASGNSSKTNVNVLITSLFGIKFFSYLIIAIIFFVLEKNKPARLYFILFLFINYILFTTALLTQTLKYFKSIDKTN